MRHRSPITLATLTVLAALAPRPAAAAGELECIPRVPDPIWSDKSSGGSHNVSIWRAPAGQILGDLALASYSHNGELCGFVDRTGDPTNPALRPARGFLWRYNDRKTGARTNVSIWEPVCDDGYVAMGVVAAPDHLNDIAKICPADQLCTDHRLPEEVFARFRCVRADLTRPIGGAPAFVWNDKKTGGAHDVSFWSRPAGAGQPGLQNLAYFWVHRSHATPAPAALTVARHELRPGVVTLPQPLAAVDDTHYYNFRLKGTNLYVALENAGLGEAYTLITDAADPRAQFHMRKVGGKFEIVNRSSGGVMFAGDKVGAPQVEETAQVQLPTLIKNTNQPARAREWTFTAQAGGFKIASTAGGRAVVWAANAVGGSRLLSADQASAAANVSVFEAFEVARINTPGARGGVFDPDLGDDRLARVGIAIGAGLLNALTKGVGGTFAKAFLDAFSDPNKALADALTRLYDQVQIDIGQEVAANALTAAGNALLDATYGLTIAYPDELRDFISDPSRLATLQNSAKDAARAFLAVRQAVTLERQGSVVARKPVNAFKIEGGLQIFQTAAPLHAAALQEAALVAAFDKVGNFDDEIKTLGDEIEKWIAEYEAMYKTKLDWRRDSVAVSVKYVAPRFIGFGGLRNGTLDIKLTEAPTLVTPVQTVGLLHRDLKAFLVLNPSTPFENAIRARYVAELDAAHADRFHPVEFAANLRAVKAATAELCAKIRADGSPERQAYLDSALAGRGVSAVGGVGGVGGVGVKNVDPKSPLKSTAKPPRRTLKLVKQGNTFTWQVETTPG